MIKLKCKVCSKKFIVGNYRKNTAKYCSYKCLGIANRSRSPWCKGLKLPYNPHYRHRGSIPWNKGKKNIYSKKTRQRISDSLKKYKGEKASAWKGGRYETQGYVCIYMPTHPRVKNNAKKHIFEHILVAEKKLGRYLKISEVVHHLNGIRNDNRPENIVVMTRGDHMKKHNPLQFRTSEDMLKHRKCSVIGCNEKHWAKNYCKKHYKQWKHKRGIFKV